MMEPQEIMDAAEEKFYSEKFYFSYSSLTKLLWNPIAFHQMYIMKVREEKTSPSLIAGSLIHLLILREQDFDKEYIISPSKLPSDSNKLVIDRVFNHYKEVSADGDERKELVEFSNAILDVLVDINLHQSLKTDQQRIDKIINNDSISYWSYLINSGSKTVIDNQTYDYCSKAANMIKNDPEMSKQLGINVTEFDNCQVYNEIELQKDLENHPYGIKGILDNLVIDHDNKKIIINDLKTTSKDLKDFPESIEFYSYWMQAIIYIILVYYKYMHLVDGHNYKLEFNFVVIDRNLMYYSFPVSESTKVLWLDRLNEEAFIPATYHYTNRKYFLPYKFCTKKFVI